MKINFNEIYVKSTKRWTDADGKKHQQTRKFWQTENPFNKNADGSVKSRQQIYNEVNAECDAWLKEKP